MIQKQYPYHLATPAEQRAMGNKQICPQCGKKEFVPYLYKNGEIVGEGVGKCERIYSCTYYKSPREYYDEHPSVYDALGLGRERQMVYVPDPEPSYIDKATLEKTLCCYDGNNLVTYFNEVLGVELTNKMIAEYFIGTAKHWGGSTVFWQIDKRGHIRTGKVMQYYAKGHIKFGHRVNEPCNRIDWVHSLMKIPDYNLRQCLFGEHLLGKYPDMTIAIVESEKTAILVSAVCEDCIGLACGGCGGLSSKLCVPLTGRDVVLFPDNGKYEEWHKKGKQLRNIFGRLRISDIMEREAQHPGDDIGDLIVEKYLNGLDSLDWGLTEL